MSFQITVLKILAGHPGGRLSIGDLKNAVAILMTSGPDWTARTRRLLARAPGLDIFTSGYVLRDNSDWLITDLGRTFLVSIEAPAPELAIELIASIEPACRLEPLQSSERSNVVSMVDHQDKRRGRAAA